ncbi:Protein of unknown function [Gryllus bimaculatus]|nr:Protein of unknown function [Gryllus bimaculatus]
MSYMAEDMAQNKTGSHTNLDLPKPTGDVRLDWELLTNVVQTRRHYWTQYLAYARATNRELMRISDEIYPQPRYIYSNT